MMSSAVSSCHRVIAMERSFMPEQEHALDAVQSFTHAGPSLMLNCGGPLVAIAVLTPTLIRVRLAPNGIFAPRRSWAVARDDDEFDHAPFEIREQEDTIVLDTGTLAVRVERAGCRISFADRAGQAFCADGDGMRWGDVGHVACAKRIEAGEHFYGFGERTGQLDKLGHHMTNWTTDPAHGHGPGTDPLYIAIPVGMALRPGLAYGIFFNNTWRSSFDIGAARPGTWLMEAGGGELDYYVMTGATPEQVSEQIGRLLGTAPLPPRWSLGYHQSRWGYVSEAMVREVAAEFRTRDLPCDVIHFDIDHMRG